MKNKKILKSLAAMAVGTVMVAGSFSLAACGHKHTWGEDYGKDGASGHYRICTGCDEHSETEPHTLNNNGECTVCHWTSAPSTTVAVASVSLNKNTLSLKVGASETLTATVAPANATNKNVIWSVTAGDAVTVSASGAVTAVKEGTATVTVTTQDGDKTATCTVTVTNNGGGEENPPVDKQDVTFNASTDISAAPASGATLVEGVTTNGDLGYGTTSRDVYHPSLDGGKSTIKNRVQLNGNAKGIKFNLEANATVLVYASGADANSVGSLQLYVAGEKSGDIVSIGKGGDKDVGVAEFSFNANTEYEIRRGTSSTVNVLFIAIHYGELNEVKGDLVPAVPVSCEEDGMLAHYLSNYGKYYAEDGTTIKLRSDLVQVKTGHNYSLVDGSVVAATETTPGSAQIKCANETNSINVELPILTSNDYTTRPNVGESGNYVYRYRGVEITFTGVGVGAATVTWTDIYSIPTFTGINVGTSKTDGQNCVYASEGVAAVQADGSLLIGDASAATKAYIALGTGETSGVVKISGSIKLGVKTGNWTFFQILNSANEEIVGFRTGGSSGPWGYRLSAGTLTSNTIENETANWHAFEIVLDLDKSTVTITVDTTVLADKVAYSGNSLNVSSIAFANINAGRSVSLQSITVAKQG